MNKKLRKACVKYLQHVEEHGIRRVYEVLPGWLKEHEPDLYSQLPEMRMLAKLPHKNDLAYRAMGAEEKARIKEQRTNIYRSIGAQVAKPLQCAGCNQVLDQTGSKHFAPMLINLIYPNRRHCSIRCMANDPEVTRQKQATNLKRYGHVCNLNSAQGIKQKKKTWRKKYGVENPSHAPEVIGKILSGRYGRKTVELNGVTYEYQGYEHVVLRALAESDTVKSFTTRPRDIGTFAYSFESIDRKYLPDVLVHRRGKNKPLYLEIKSVATLAPTKAVARKVRAKAKAMWEEHDADYRVILCSRSEVLAFAENYEELRDLIREYRQY